MMGRHEYYILLDRISKGHITDLEESPGKQPAPSPVLVLLSMGSGFVVFVGSLYFLYF